MSILPRLPHKLETYLSSLDHLGSAMSRIRIPRERATSAAGLSGQFRPALAGPHSNVPWQTPAAVYPYMTTEMPVGNDPSHLTDRVERDAACSARPSASRLRPRKRAKRHQRRFGDHGRGGRVALTDEPGAKRTGSQIRTILHNSAVSDVFTGHVPNSTWGLGKLNMLAAADIVAAMIRANPVLLRTSITFPAQKVGTLSAPASVIRMT
jgi:hypothetical protein